MNKEYNAMSEYKSKISLPAAVQGLDLPEPGIRQLHPARYQLEHTEDAEIQDFFFLITGINEKEKNCEVIPGSFEGLMAGPDDIVLPKNVLGQWAYLSLDMIKTVPFENLGKGFAKLDDHSFALVQKTIEEYRQDSSYRKLSLHRAMPYISDNDDRIAYHNRQRLLLEQLTDLSARNRRFHFKPPFKHFYKAAGILFVGALVTLCYVATQQSSSLPEPPAPQPAGFAARYSNLPTEEEFAPTGILRGQTDAIPVYSPQGMLYSRTPQIAIGGTEKQHYTVTIRDMANKVLGEKTILGGECIHWEDFTGSSEGLKEDEVYTVQIKSGKHTVKKSFYLLDKDERGKIASLIAKQSMLRRTVGAIITDGTISGAAGAAIGASALGATPENEYKIAKILFEQSCYSEAYLKIKLLYDSDKANKEYKALYDKCLKKLGIK